MKKEIFTRFAVSTLCDMSVISHFGFEGRILILIEPVPGQCSSSALLNTTTCGWTLLKKLIC